MKNFKITKSEMFFKAPIVKNVAGKEYAREEVTVGELVASNLEHKKKATRLSKIKGVRQTMQNEMDKLSIEEQSFFLLFYSDYEDTRFRKKCFANGELSYVLAFEPESEFPNIFKKVQYTEVVGKEKVKKTYLDFKDVKTKFYYQKLASKLINSEAFREVSKEQMKSSYGDIENLKVVVKTKLMEIVKGNNEKNALEAIKVATKVFGIVEEEVTANLNITVAQLDKSLNVNLDNSFNFIDEEPSEDEE